MAEQQFNPGVSLAGAVDLEALKHQVKAKPGQAGGAPVAGGYVCCFLYRRFLCSCFLCSCFWGCNRQRKRRCLHLSVC